MRNSLIDGTKATKALREKIQKSYSSDHKLVATIMFKLRTTEELEAMGNFGEIPDYEAPDHTTAEQKRAIKATTPKTKKEDDASSIAEGEEVDYEEDEKKYNASVAGSSKKSRSASVAESVKKTASVAPSVKKAASKTSKGKPTKSDTPNKSTGKKTKTTKEDFEEEEPNPKVENTSASKPSKAKALIKEASTPAKTPAKAISISSDASTDDTNEDEEEAESIAVKGEQYTSTQPPDRTASIQNEISIEDMKAYMEAEETVKGQDDGIFFSNPFATIEMPQIQLADNLENTDVMGSSNNVELAETMEKELGPIQAQDELEIATSKGLEEEIEKAMMVDQNIEVHDITVSEPLTTPQKKPLSLQGSPAAPAHHAWLKRDLELARLATEIEESRYAPDLPTAVEETDMISPTWEPITPSAALSTTDPQTTAINPSKSDEMPQDLGDIIMADIDSSYDDDLDAAQTTPSRCYGGLGRNRQIDLGDVSPFTTRIGRAESVILGVTSFEYNTTSGDASQDAMRQVESVPQITDDTSQATDVAPLDEVLASVANSKREGPVDNGMLLDLDLDDDEKLNLSKHVANDADDSQVSARSASLALASLKTKVEVVIDTRTRSTPAKVKAQDIGEAISQSQISTQSHDSQHQVSSSPVPEYAKVGTASGQKKSSKDDSDETILPKSKPATTTATAPKTKAKRKSDITVDTAAESSPEPELKKKTPTKPAEKRKRISVNEPPKQAANTTVKKAAEKRKYPAKPAAKTADKRKSVSISDTKTDTDSPRKSAAAPAGRNTVELEMLTAKAKLEAAEKRKLELEEEYKAALLVKDERDKVRTWLRGLCVSKWKLTCLG